MQLDYDYLIVATGAHLDFAGTPGLGPDEGTTYSICTMEHAAKTRDRYLETVERMAGGEQQRIVIGTGHPGATCQGAAFETSPMYTDLVKKQADCPPRLGTAPAGWYAAVQLDQHVAIGEYVNFSQRRQR